jgi:hypothetical protein
MPMTFKIDRLVRGEHFNAQALRAGIAVLSNRLTLITAHFVDRLANVAKDARLNLMRCFALLRKGDS